MSKKSSVNNKRIAEFIIMLLKNWVMYLVGVEIITLLMDGVFTSTDSIMCLVAATASVAYKVFLKDNIT